MTIVNLYGIANSYKGFDQSNYELLSRKCYSYPTIYPKKQRGLVYKVHFPETIDSTKRISYS